MKYLLLSFLLVATAALADTEVIVTGKGKTCDQAIENAKIAAVDTAVGLWLTAERDTDGKQYAERITSYSGGLITKYEILTNECTNVTIKATVVPRSNRMVSNSAYVKKESLSQLQSQLENDVKRNAALNLLNDRSKAFVYNISTIEFKLIDGETLVIIEGELSYQEKWLNDYINLQQQAGRLNLTNFYKPVYVKLIGFKNNRKVFEHTYQYNTYNDFPLYAITPNGIVIDYESRSKLRLTFNVESGKIMSVDKFEVNLL